MSAARILFLPSVGDEGYRWMRIDNGAIAARGDGMPPMIDGDESPAIAVVPAEDVTLHWADLPDRSPAQSIAAARLLVAEASAAPLNDLHVAVGREAGSEDRPIGVVSAARMRHWLHGLAAAGVDPDAMIPLPMLLPRPDDGFVRAYFGAGWKTGGVVRGQNSGFADEAELTELITGGIAPTLLPREVIEEAILAAVQEPPLDLRQGAFEKRRQTEIDWPRIRRMGWLVLSFFTISLAISLILILKYSFAADELERRIDLMARQGLPRSETVSDPARQLDARLVRLRGPGMGFSATAAAVFDTIRAVPGTEASGIAFDQNGALRLSLVTQNEGQIKDVIARLQAQGFTVTPSPFEQGSGRLSGVLTVARP